MVHSMCLMLMHRQGSALQRRRTRWTHIAILPMCWDRLLILTKAILIGQSSYFRKMHPSIAILITERNNFLIWTATRRSFSILGSLDGCLFDAYLFSSTLYSMAFILMPFRHPAHYQTHPAHHYDALPNLHNYGRGPGAPLSCWNIAKGSHQITAMV